MKKILSAVFLIALLALSAGYLVSADRPCGEEKAPETGKKSSEKVSDGKNAGSGSALPEKIRLMEENRGDGAGKSEAGGEGETEEYGYAGLLSSYTILVNRDRPVPEDYDPDIITVPGRNVKGERRAAEALREMLAAGEKEGLRFVVCSGYRTREEQRKLYLNQIQRRLETGMTQAEAVAEARAVSALPGTSEHETGLAFDIVALAYQNLDEGYALTGEAVWLRENAAGFGFILRYPPEKSEITGITYEPWHYRYVGEEAARVMEEQGLTLEEFLKKAENRPLSTGTN